MGNDWFVVDHMVEVKSFMASMFEFDTNWGMGDDIIDASWVIIDTLEGWLIDLDSMGTHCGGQP